MASDMNTRKLIRLLAATLVLFFASPPGASGAGAPTTVFPLVDTGRGLSHHKEMFVVPLSWSRNYEGDRSEVVFQLSAKYRIRRTRFYLAYSQISFWQAYDRSNSSPFRDTNYNPEVFYRSAERRLFGGRFGVDAVLEHESNGRLVGESRSWNLISAAPFWRSDRWLVYLKARYRIPEDPKETPDSALGDDNPDITHYLGYSDVHVIRDFGRGRQLRLTLRGFLGRGRGLVRLAYSAPITADDDSWVCLRVSSGYGESLMDYNRANTRVGLGIMFSR